MTISSQRLPGLDGLRALAVSCVLFSHAFASAGFPTLGWLSQLQRTFSGLFGVQVFFTISGFIITLLLCREKQGTGSVSLKQFWLRRALRILPPAVAYLLVVQVVMIAGAAPVPGETQWGSLLFYRNFMPQEPWFTADQGLTAHYWTLSVEEQFYLFWPILVAALSPGALRRVALTGIGLSVVLRACGVFLPPGHERWLPMNLDGFMLGALVALGVPGLTFWRWRWPLLVAALVLTRLQASGLQVFVAPIQPLAVALAAAVWIAGLVRNPEGIESRLLNSRPLVALGVISYSVYLWQQICLAPASHWSSGVAPWFTQFPQNLILCLLCGTLSYLLVERPCQRLKTWLSNRRTHSQLTALSHASPGLH
ncbi:MAG: acyltransferase [Prosthecobacter sp.]|nr:acyltransferase [Prosthecobacter sp.]